VPREVACDGNWLNGEGSPLIAEEKSAEGIVVRLGRTKARTVPREGMKREERSFVEKER